MSDSFVLTVSPTVATSLTVPLATITSVLGSAESAISSNMAALETATDTNVQLSLAQDVQALSASISYYSLLGVQVTATDEAVIASAAEEAAYASAVSQQIFNDNSFFHGKEPNKGGNAALLAVFALFLLLHLIFGVFYGQWWFLVCYCSGLFLEVIGYAGRIWLDFNLKSFDGYVMQLVCLTLAPCFLMAGIYYNLAQLTIVMGQRYSILKPMQYSLIFIICDLISIVLQAIGGAMSAAALNDHKSTRGGSNVMVAGLAYQVFSMAVFQILWFIFLKRCYASYKKYGDSAFAPEFQEMRARKMFRPFFPALTLSVLFVFIRSIYRLIEMAQGFDGHLANTEIYFLILESLMVALSVILLTVCHPGFAYGRHANINVDKGLKNSFTLKTERYKDTGPLGMAKELGRTLSRSVSHISRGAFSRSHAGSDVESVGEQTDTVKAVPQEDEEIYAKVEEGYDEEKAHSTAAPTSATQTQTAQDTLQAPLAGTTSKSPLQAAQVAQSASTSDLSTTVSGYETATSESIAGDGYQTAESELEVSSAEGDDYPTAAAATAATGTGADATDAASVGSASTLEA